MHNALFMCVCQAVCNALDDRPRNFLSHADFAHLSYLIAQPCAREWFHDDKQAVVVVFDAVSANDVGMA